MRGRPLNTEGMTTAPTVPDPHAVTFASGAVTLSGSLTLPSTGTGTGTGPCPAVVMVGGSGPTDRDNDVYFPPLRRHLVAAGVGVLSYDKRGVGGSSGDWRDATLDDLAADADAALRFLRTRPGVRAGATGLFGHSEGGWVVLRAATARDDVPWVVTNSCPATTPAVQERHALATALRQEGADGADADAELALYDRLCAAARRGAGLAEASRLVEAAGTPPVLARTYWAGMDARLWEFLRRKQDHDPVPDARGLRCPHLAVFGGADPLVPVADSVRLFGAAACHPERPPRARLTVEVFPGADHRVSVRTHEGGPSCPVPGHLAALARWIGAVTAELE